MSGAPGEPRRIEGLLPDPAATERLGAALAAALSPGDALLLEGGLGAGKSALARALIQSRLAAEGRWEETPSPSYTLLQTYETAAGPILHADLYRLSGPDEAAELGLLEPLAEALLVVEWPERLGPHRPERRLELRLAIVPAASGRPEEAGRRLEAVFVGGGWEKAAEAVAAALAGGRPGAGEEKDGAV